MSEIEGKGNARYRSGTVFEGRIRKALHESGYVCMRGAGSKGPTKADLAAFSPHGVILLVQAKTNGVISETEWNRLYFVARWFAESTGLKIAAGGGLVVSDPVCRLVVPIIASRDHRGRLVMHEITGPRIRMKPHINRELYDWRCACSVPHPNLAAMDTAEAKAAKAARAAKAV